MSCKLTTFSYQCTLNIMLFNICSRFFIAFGWIQNTLEGDEQANPHTVQAGYSKGGGTTVSVHVELVQDPQASFHASEFIGLHCELVSTVIQRLQCHVFQIQVILEEVSLFHPFPLLLVPPPPMCQSL